MNPTAIYSKTGKGVQEASGKTSHLSRGDRAILAAIDGKITVQQLSAKFDRAADDKFFALLRKMDEGGFIREVSPGTVQRGAANAPRPAAKAPPPPAGGGEELDFTQIFSAPPKMEKPPAPTGPAPTPSKDPMVAAREAAEARARAEREAKAKAAAAEKAAMMSTQQVRMDAELRAKIEREKVMAAAAEGKTRAEIEARERAERDARARAEADAKAAAEAAARAQAEAERQAKERAERDARERVEAERQARERAEQEAKERAERETREKAQAAERARFEAAERARREAEELRFKIEEERRAREEAERRAREEAERTRREAEERARREAEEKKAREEAEALRKKYEEEKKAREEAERRAEEARLQRERERQEEERKAREEYERQEAERRAADEAARKAREAEERKEAEEHQRQIILAREAEDKKRRDAESRRKKEEEARRWEVEEARRKSDEAYRLRAEEEDKHRAEREAVEAAERAEADKKAAAEADALAGSLLADLDSFSQREEDDRKAKAEEEEKRRAEAERRAKEEQAERERLEAEKKARRAEEKRRREEEEQRQREEAERREREEEARRKEAEAEKKKKEREEAARKKDDGDIPIGASDLDMGDVDEDTRKLSPEARKALRDRQREVARARTRGETAGGTVAAAYRRKRQPTSWGKPAAIFLFLVLVIGAGVANFVPLGTKEYESLASDALGAPVKIGSANLYVFNGVQVRFQRVTVGEGVKIGKVHAVPELGALFGDAKVFSRVELHDLVLRQDALGDALFGAMKPGQLRVARVSAEGAKLEGPLSLPVLDFDASIGDAGKVFSIRLTGERVTGLVTPRAADIGFEITARNLNLPFLPDVGVTEFGMKGSADRTGMTVAAFDARAYDGTLVGTARIQWGAQWSAQGDIEARAMNAAVFSPQMVSEGRLGAKGRYAMGGPDPAKLYESARLDGQFEVLKGALGSFDISRALQSSSAQASGRTPFSELQGSLALANGALAFRDLRMSAGLLSATGSLDIDAKGALSGRVNAELRNLRGTFYIGGRLADPQLRR